MKAVGIKVLKDNLSRYIAYVREGGTVYVTDRDTIVAEIHRPTLPGARRVSAWESFLNDAERRGAVRGAKGAPVPSITRLPRLYPRPVGVDLQRLMDEVKSD
jgi:antitoxin (DNA-binding transcriptional repressor) of toxin-antitoxin stability system